MILPLDAAPGPASTAEECRSLLSEASKLLETGNLRTSAEKAWIAVSDLVGAVGEVRGQPAKAAWEKRKVILELMDQTGDRSLMGCYFTTRHAHFYLLEEHYETSGVKQAISAASDLVEKLYPEIAAHHRSSALIESTRTPQI